MAQHSRPGSGSWPSVDGRQATPLFLGRQPFRKLVVLLDSAVLDPVHESTWSKEWLLAGLLTLEMVECLRYADDGPPADAAHQSDKIFGDWTIGWAVLGAEEQGAPMGHRSVQWSVDDESVTDSALIGDVPQAAAGDSRTRAYSGMDRAAAAERRRSDALAAKVAETVGADIFITERQYLYEATWTIADGVTYCHLDDALRVVGLYLRSQGSFIISRDPAGRGTHTMNRGLYYWVGTRELLPSAWRWFSACVQYSAGIGDNSLMLLGQSVLQPQRALQVRDEVRVALNKPQNNDTADEALSSLDIVLLLLMGAVDATARVVHSVLEMSSSPMGPVGKNPGGLLMYRRRLHRSVRCSLPAPMRLTLSRFFGCSETRSTARHCHHSRSVGRPARPDTCRSTSLRAGRVARGIHGAWREGPSSA